MRLTSVLSPLSTANLRLASQCGVTDIVTRYPGPRLDDLVRVKETAGSQGLRLSVVEGHLPIERIKLGADHDGQEMAALKQLIRHMGRAKVPILCYNFMPGTDWVRTRLDLRERGGALVTGFDLDQVESAVSLSETTKIIPEQTIDSDALWNNLENMLKELVPLAEENGVDLALHPDDPPLSDFQGKARIMGSVESFERQLNLVPSAHNGICFCQGTFSAMGVDLENAIGRLGPGIRYVHFRDLRGTAESFVETFHDNGPTDMLATMRAYREAGLDVPIRPDHVPQLEGEEEGEPGYTMLGRLFAFGYIRALIQATEQNTRA